MHILSLPSFFPPHGGRFCLEQAKALKAFGHEVRIVSVIELGMTLDRQFYLTAPWTELQQEIDGVEVFMRYMRALPKAVRSNTDRWVETCCQMVERYIRRYGCPDVLHAHCCKSAGLAAAVISECHGIPFFITEHISSGIIEKDFGYGWQRHTWLRERMLETYRQADCVIPVCRELVDDLAPFFGTDYRFMPVSNTIDTDHFSFRQREQREGRPFRFCCLAIGDLYGKGFDVLAKATAMLHANIELHIAGSGSDSPAIQHLFEGQQGIHFHGFLSKEGVRDLLWQCDALVLPSRSEAQPLVLLEAMSTGLPVVSTDCTPASLRIPGACLIAPRGDADALAQRMQDVMQITPSPAFSAAVRQLASPETVARQLTDIFTR